MAGAVTPPAQATVSPPSAVGIPEVHTMAFWSTLDELADWASLDGATNDLLTARGSLYDHMGADGAVQPRQRGGHWAGVGGACWIR